MAQTLIFITLSGKVGYSDSAVRTEVRIQATEKAKKLIDNLIEIVYVNVLFMVMASIIVLPLLALIFWSDQSMGVCGNC